MINLKIKLLSDTARMPEQKNKEDVGWDCFVDSFEYYEKDKKKTITVKQFILPPHDWIGCNLGFATEIPPGYYAQLFSRSGLAIRYGIHIITGTIDAGYRGQWTAIVLNSSFTTYALNHGDKICQFIIRKIEDLNLQLVTELNESIRGENGFGSSGKK